MRPSNESLTTAYMRDIECNAREIAAGRTDLFEYDAKIRAELAALKAAQASGQPIRVSRYGMPEVAK